MDHLVSRPVKSLHKTHMRGKHRQSVRPRVGLSSWLGAVSSPLEPGGPGGLGLSPVRDGWREWRFEVLSSSSISFSSLSFIPSLPISDCEGTHSFTHSLIHSFTHSLTHSLTSASPPRVLAAAPPPLRPLRLLWLWLFIHSSGASSFLSKLLFSPLLSLGCFLVPWDSSLIRSGDLGAGGFLPLLFAAKPASLLAWLFRSCLRPLLACLETREDGGL